MAKSSSACRVIATTMASLCLLSWQPRIVTADPVAGTLGAPQPIGPGHLALESSVASGIDFTSQQPHPAVARIVVPEGDATSYGSGTLVDVREQYGLVVTNWHVVRDGMGEVEVVFPDGFRSQARPLKVDADWDLAALVIWRPPAAPVRLATRAPQPGEQLTICGYGSGSYRAATGRCTQYYAPKVELPQHMVELDVEARQGDSGGPIFNARGELAGVLFGAGQGTTLGSFGGRVENFLASLAPNIGSGTQGTAAMAHAEAPQSALEADAFNHEVSAMLVSTSAARHADRAPRKHQRSGDPAPGTLGAEATPVDGQWEFVDVLTSDVNAPKMPAATDTAMLKTGLLHADTSASDFAWLESGKSILALIGAATLMVQLLRVIR